MHIGQKLTTLLVCVLMVAICVNDNKLILPPPPPPQTATCIKGNNNDSIGKTGEGRSSLFIVVWKCMSPWNLIKVKFPMAQFRLSWSKVETILVKLFLSKVQTLKLAMVRSLQNSTQTLYLFLIRLKTINMFETV